MRIAVISDIHANHWVRSYGAFNLYGADNPFPDVQSVVQYLIDKAREQQVDRIYIAGDVSDNFAKNNSNETFANDIIYIPGNHDYYNNDYPSGIIYYEDADTFATTLWTNFEGSQHIADQVFSQITDKRLINKSSALLLATDFEASWDMIRKSDKDIIMTHYPPSRKSVARQFLGSNVNSYFCNDLDSAILAAELPARLWICGHVHHSHYYNIGNTFVVCHPVGYPSENYTFLSEYQPLIIEIDDFGVVLANHQQINWKS